METKQRFWIRILFGQINLSENLAAWGLFLLRFYAGFTILRAGLDKLPLPQWMIDQVVTLGLPFPEFFAWIASFGEFAFGTLLCLGLMTRFSGFVLAIIMGVASFGFQRVLPLLDMHIAQQFFWMFVLFALIGGGKFSIDYWMHQRAQKQTRIYFLALPAFLFLLGIGLYREFGIQQEEVKEETAVVISSVNIPGTFNNWDPAANEMQQVDEDNYQLSMAFDVAQVIEFKFTANKSWDINIGEVDQEMIGFPISGKAESNNGNNPQNIRAYIPAAGTYQFDLNIKDYSYRLDSIPSN